VVNRYAVIEAGVVANVAVAEEPFADNWMLCPDQVGPGWLYDGSEFSPPPPPPPPSREEQEAARKAAYTAEADPLFFKWQAGETVEEEWKAKRQELRDRYPYPEEN
jgi:hypothetical protein